MDALKRGLRENNLLEGKDYLLDARWAHGEYDRFPAFVRELIEQNPAVIIVSTISAVRAAKNATTTIPIVMATMNDPVGFGIVTSLARPGGNVTGLATLNEDVTPKLMEWFHVLLPKATTLAVLLNPANPSNSVILDRIRVLAGPISIAVRASEKAS